MEKVKNYCKNILWTTGDIIKTPVTISKWYGRLGNNIQQIAIAILYAQKNKRRAIIPNHSLIRPIFYGDKKLTGNLFANKNRFFFFGEPQADNDVTLDYDYVCRNIHKIANDFIAPNFKFDIGQPFDHNVLVIHLRAGDIFDTTKYIHQEYVQNPLSFFDNLIIKFKKTIIVSEPGIESPILSALKHRPTVTTQSSSIETDFQTLLRARNLATSGVGTFSIAAALCSKNLENLFCTDVFSPGHLNPQMIRNGVNVHCIKVMDEYIKIGNWLASQEQIDQMLTHQIDKKYFSNIQIKID